MNNDLNEWSTKKAILKLLWHQRRPINKSWNFVQCKYNIFIRFHPSIFTFAWVHFNLQSGLPLYGFFFVGGKIGFHRSGPNRKSNQSPQNGHRYLRSKVIKVRDFAFLSSNCHNFFSEFWKSLSSDGIFWINRLAYWEFYSNSPTNL